MTPRCSVRPEGQRAADPWRSLVSCSAYYQWRVFKEKVLSKDGEQTLQPEQTPVNRADKRFSIGELFWEQPGLKAETAVVGSLLAPRWTVVPKILRRTSCSRSLNPKNSFVRFASNGYDQQRWKRQYPGLDVGRSMFGPNRSVYRFPSRDALGQPGCLFG